MTEKPMGGVKTPPEATKVPNVAANIILGASHMEKVDNVSILNFFRYWSTS